MIDTKINKNITMKKNLILRLMLPMLILSHFVNAQSNAQEKNNLSVKKDDIIIDVFYGWPYFNGTVLKSLSDGYNLTNAKNTNHLGGKAEYMLTENIGLGAEFTYANASIRYQSSINGFYEIAGVSKIRALGRFNYHFSATEMLDPYATFGIGYKRTTFYDTGSINTVSQSFNIFPVAIKMAIGMRVYFNDRIGLNFETGLGGPLITAGLTVKI
jgi:outer membrane protein W